MNQKNTNKFMELEPYNIRIVFSALSNEQMEFAFFKDGDKIFNNKVFFVAVQEYSNMKIEISDEDLQCGGVYSVRGTENAIDFALALVGYYNIFGFLDSFQAAQDPEKQYYSFKVLSKTAKIELIERED